MYLTSFLHLSLPAQNLLVIQMFRLLYKTAFMNSGTVIFLVVFTFISFLLFFLWFHQFIKSCLVHFRLLSWAVVIWSLIAYLGKLDPKHLHYLYSYLLYFYLVIYLLTCLPCQITWQLLIHINLHLAKQLIVDEILYHTTFERIP